MQDPSEQALEGPEAVESLWVEGAGSTSAAVLGPLEPNEGMSNSWHW